MNASAWPVLLAMSLMHFLISFMWWSYFYLTGGLIFDFGYWHWKMFSPVMFFIIFLLILMQWFIDMMREGTYEGKHTAAVKLGLKYGFYLFLLSEIMFFFSFFWAYFHVSSSPNIYIGMIWPPKYLCYLDCFGLPLLNTMLLLSSGLMVTYGHQALLATGLWEAVEGLAWAMSYGLIFTCMQLYEYSHTKFSMNDGIFGSIFFLLTGFHGLHVIIGTIFLSVCLLSAAGGEFTLKHHLGLEMGMYYWHMVDVIWILLFLCLYVW